MNGHYRNWIVLAALFFGVMDDSTAEAWGHEGHQTIGAIADSLLVGSHAENEVTKILGSEKLETAALWADCVKGVSTTAPYKYHLKSRYRECDPFQQTEAGRQGMEDYVRRNSTACRLESSGEACHKQYHYTDVAIEHATYDRADEGTSDHDVVSVIYAAIAKLTGQPVPAPISFDTKKEALRVLAHLVGDVHQPLHVGAIYLDAAGHELDPDANTYDPATKTRGGNLLIHGRDHKLHAEWDAIPRRLTVSQFLSDGITLGKLVPVTTGPVSGWPRAWATETVGVSRAAFSSLSFGAQENTGTRRAKWPVTEPTNYATRRAALQKAQLVKAGARLAQILEVVFP